MVGEKSENILCCYLDIETTGLEKEKDFITEIAYIVRGTGDKKPRRMVSELVWDARYGENPCSPEIEALTGISSEHLAKFGRDVDDVFQEFLDDTAGVDFFVAHNGMNFDRPFLLEFLKRFDFAPQLDEHRILHENLWLDSQQDIEWLHRSLHLGHLAAAEGFLNPFPHHALSDVMTMMRLVHHRVPEMIACSRVPWVVVAADVTYDNRELAKKGRYRWEDVGDGKRYPKTWVKRIKEDKIPAEIAAQPFKVRVV